MKLWLQTSLGQERLKSNIEFRYQIIATAVKFCKSFYNVYDTDSLV